MTTILCACGCGRPRRDGSKYFSERCQQAVSRLRKKERGMKYILHPEKAEERAKVRHEKYASGQEGRRNVIVTDPMCGDPYVITMKEYEIFKPAYAEMKLLVRIDAG